MALYLALFVLNVMDVISTRRALAEGCTEANPLMAWVMDRLGVVRGLLAVKLPLLGIIGYCVWSGIATDVALYVLIAIYTAVVINNVRLVWKANGNRQ
jgi:hypothetical protein